MNHNDLLVLDLLGERRAHGDRLGADRDLQARGRTLERDRQLATTGLQRELDMLATSQVCAACTTGSLIGCGMTATEGNTSSGVKPSG